MNAQTPIPAASAESAAQSLIALCKMRRWNLLQQYARLEIALRHKLENPPKTFGAKVRAWIKLDPTAKRFECLITARNLAAHALIRSVRIDDITFVVWEIADGANELNCAKFDKPALKAWTNDLDCLLEEAIAVLAA